MERFVRLVFLVATITAMVTCYPAVSFPEALEEMTKIANELLKQNEENTRITSLDGNTEMKFSAFKSIISIGNDAVSEDSEGNHEIVPKTKTESFGPYHVISGTPENDDETSTQSTSEQPEETNPKLRYIFSVVTPETSTQNTSPEEGQSFSMSTTETPYYSSTSFDQELSSPSPMPAIFEPFYMNARIKAIETSTQNTSPEQAEVTKPEEGQSFSITTTDTPYFSSTAIDQELSSPSPMADILEPIETSEGIKVIDDFHEKSPYDEFMTYQNDYFD